MKKRTDINERGITLVALVITIVILIILAVVAINAVFGDSGLLQYAQDSRDYQANADATDAGMINSATEYIDGIIGGKGSTEPLWPIKVSEAKESGEIFKETTELEDNSGDSVWIPGGFRVTDDSATDADDGVVVTDGTNEFVWIPVPDYTTMYTEAADTALSGSSAGVNTTTDVYSKLRIRSGDSFIAGTPNSTNVREPDILSSYDTQEQYYSLLGYNSAKEMADGLVEEYTATYNSIKKYKRFYIGRYELTGSVDSPTIKKGQTIITDQNWYYYKKICTNIVSTEYAQSEMIYGNQWDEVMSWLISSGEKTEEEVNVDSSSWGNYSNSTGEAATGSGVKQVSGYNEAWKANNIYDLAGNCCEWTQEASSIEYRVGQGRWLLLFWFTLSSIRT